MPPIVRGFSFRQAWNEKFIRFNSKYLNVIHKFWNREYNILAFCDTYTAFRRRSMSVIFYSTYEKISWYTYSDSKQAVNRIWLNFSVKVSY